jgi:NTE family protein
MPPMKSVETGAPGAVEVADLERPAPGPNLEGEAVMKGRFRAETTLVRAAKVPVPTVAFVLQGGGSLAAGQVGMLRALLEAGIRPDLVVGSSAGALNGVAFAQNPTDAGLDELQELWARIRRSDIFPFSPRHLVHGLTGRHSGLVSPDRLRALLARSIGIGRLEDTVIPVRVVTTDAATGRPVVLSSGSTVPALLASAALPGVFPPVELGGRLLIDGGVAADIPILQAEESGATTSYLLPMGSAGPTRLAQGALTNALLATRQMLSRITADDVAMARGQVHVLPAPATASVNPMDFRSSRQLIRDGYDTTRSWLSVHATAA